MMMIIDSDDDLLMFFDADDTLKPPLGTLPAPPVGQTQMPHILL